MKGIYLAELLTTGEAGRNWMEIQEIGMELRGNCRELGGICREIKKLNERQGTDGKREELERSGNTENT